MIRRDFVRECLRGGPGLDGYAYRADVWCCGCAAEIVRGIADTVGAAIASTDDPDFNDSEVVPCPIFFGEHEEKQHCAECGEFLYGGNLDDC